MKNQIILLLLLFYSSLYGVTIKKIVVVGNNITKEHIILETISHEVGDTININLAIKDQLNLYNLGLFYDVIIHPADSIYYIYTFEKSDVLFRPKFEKDDVGRWSYGISCNFNNINGENKKVQLSVLHGNTTSYDLYYINPKLSTTKDSLLIKIKNTKLINIDNLFSINRQSINSTVSFLTFRANHRIKLQMALDRNKIDFITTQYSEDIISFHPGLSYMHKKNIKKNRYKKGNILKLHIGYMIYNKNIS